MEGSEKMFDCHYDLLTYIWMKKEKKEFLKNYCDKVYHINNITGGIFNLFYMSKEEMKEEIGITEEQINVVENLKEVKEYIEENRLISENIKYIFGIEGMDYLEKIEDIDVLYSLGLRSTNIVWNHENKFGGGSKARENYGLTELGKELIEKLIKKGIAIDLSHANERTFWDIVQICKKHKEKGENPVVFASHSNAKAICDVPRNLTDEQILAIKELNGVIGIVSIKIFCVNTDDICNPNIDYEQEYIKHINYVRNLLGGVDYIAVATDDMRYYYMEPEYYQNANVYKHEEIRDKLIRSLKKNNYKDDEIEKILTINFTEKILKKI